MALPAPALAQQQTPAPVSIPEAESQIEFSADEVTYQSDTDVLTAQRQVRMSRDGNYLAAERVTQRVQFARIDLR